MFSRAAFEGHALSRPPVVSDLLDILRVFGINVSFFLKAGINVS